MSRPHSLTALTQQQQQARVQKSLVGSELGGKKESHAALQKEVAHDRDLYKLDSIGPSFVIHREQLQFSRLKSHKERSREEQHR